MASSELNNPLDKSLWRLTWPIFIDIFCLFLINIIDTWFLSAIADETAAAVGAVLPVLGLGFTLFITLNYAGNAVAARFMGAGAEHAIARCYGVLLMLLMCLGCIVAAVIFALSNTIAAGVGLEGQQQVLAAEYLRILSFGIPLLALRYGLNGVLASQGQAASNMQGTLLMTASNVVLNAVLIYGLAGVPALGAIGVAYATVGAWLLATLYSLASVYFKRIRISRPRKFRRDFSPLLSIAVPSVFEPFSWHLAQVIMITIVVQLGELALVTRVYVYNVIFVVAMYGTALSVGVQLKVSYLFGRDQQQQADKQLKQGVRVGLLGAGLMTACLFFCHRWIFALFTDDSSVITLAGWVLLLAIFCELGRMLNLIVGASLKALGDAKLVSLVGVSVMWVFCVPATYVFGVHLGWGLLGIWLALAMDECLRGGFAYWRWQGRYSVIGSTTATTA